MRHNRITTFIAISLAFAAPLGVYAADPPTTPPSTSAQAATVDMADGEVRKIDRDNKKITIKHGEIKNLDMPPMTMVFVVKDVAMFGALQAGDKIRFRAEKDKGSYLVTDIQPAK